MKKYIFLIGLGIAFMAVSLWVVISGGRSAKAVRAKFRVGGAILTLLSLTSLASCEKGGFMVSCYDPVPPPYNEIYVADHQSVSNGDSVEFGAYIKLDDVVNITILTPDDEVLQSESVEIKAGDDSFSFVVAVGDYRGEAKLIVDMLLTEGHRDTLSFNIEIVERIE